MIRQVSGPPRTPPGLGCAIRRDSIHGCGASRMLLHPDRKCIRNLDRARSGRQPHPIPTAPDPSGSLASKPSSDPSHPGSGSRRIGIALDRVRAGPGSGSRIGFAQRLDREGSRIGCAQSPDRGRPDRVHPKSGSGPSDRVRSTAWIGPSGSGAIHDRIGCDPDRDWPAGGGAVGRSALGSKSKK